MSGKEGKKSSWLKKIFIAGLILLLVGAGVAWYIFTEKFDDTSKVKSTYTVNAVDFIKEFEKNDSLANIKYRDQIITVNGSVSEIEPVDTTVNIKIIDTTTSSYIIFAFQQQHLQEARQIKVGDAVSIKGSFSSGVYSEIMETYKIDFKRCALEKK